VLWFFLGLEVRLNEVMLSLYPKTVNAINAPKPFKTKKIAVFSNGKD
jgi:hypothetical protein